MSSSSRRPGSSVAFALLERLDQVVAQPDRVGEALEADRVAVEAGDRQRARDRADRNQELVVAQGLDLALVRPQGDRSGRRVVARDRPEAQVGALEDVAQRRDHVPGLERAGRRLGQKRRVEHEVHVVDERQPRRLLRQDPLQPACRRRSGEAPSGDHDVPGHDPILAQLVTVCYKVADRTWRPISRARASR